jgi:hypothetical protein
MTACRAILCLAIACAAVATPFASGASGPFYFAPPPTGECTNVANCQASVGPWVVVPANGEASFLLSCPSRHGYIVAGTDARASSGSVRVWFDGWLGAPGGLPPTTAPGGAALLFHALSMNGKPASFQPILGCVSLIQKTKITSISIRLSTATPGVPPASPIDFHSQTIVIGFASLDRIVLRCPSNETLVGSWHSFAFQTLGPPPRLYLDAARITTSIVGRRVYGHILPQPSLLVPTAPNSIAQIGAMCEASSPS